MAPHHRHQPDSEPLYQPRRASSDAGTGFGRYRQHFLDRWPHATALFGPYSTSKFGLTAMSEGLRQEVGGKGIRVYLLEPGATNTGLWTGITNPDLRKSVKKLAQKETSMTPEDVGAAIAFVVTLPPRVNVSEMLIYPTTDVAPL
jgi:NADP-dependent 3-hydroxy acid dehydrogenase YdfG